MLKPQFYASMIFAAIETQLFLIVSQQANLLSRILTFLLGFSLINNIARAFLIERRARAKGLIK